MGGEGVCACVVGDGAVTKRGRGERGRKGGGGGGGRVESVGMYATDFCCLSKFV